MIYLPLSKAQYRLSLRIQVVIVWVMYGLHWWDLFPNEVFELLFEYTFYCCFSDVPWQVVPQFWSHVMEAITRFLPLIWHFHFSILQSSKVVAQACFFNVLLPPCVPRCAEKLSLMKQSLSLVKKVYRF